MSSSFSYIIKVQRYDIISELPKVLKSLSFFGDFITWKGEK